MHNQQKLAPDDRLVEIEQLFQTALQELKDQKDTDVDFERLFGLVEIYNNFYEPVEANERRWLKYTEEILALLDDAGDVAEKAMKHMMDVDRPMKAYQKAIETSSGE